VLPDIGHWGDFLAFEIGALVNIDHNTSFLIFCQHWSKGGACEVREATVRSPHFSSQGRDRQNDIEVP
jgi:hypothetical protein